MLTTPIKRKHPNNLKRPDLQGQFKCGSCQELFQHASSLNRHRLLRHSTEVWCLQCHRHLTSDENVRQHMLKKHHSKSFTCSCCNWTFADKKALLQHSVSMMEDRVPGEAVPVAISVHQPGSLMQETLLGRPKRDGRRKYKTKDSLANSPEEVTLEDTLQYMLNLNREQLQDVVHQVENSKIMMKRARIAELGDKLARRVGIID